VYGCHVYGFLHDTTEDPVRVDSTVGMPVPSRVSGDQQGGRDRVGDEDKGDASGR